MLCCVRAQPTKTPTTVLPTNVPHGMFSSILSALLCKSSQVSKRTSLACHLYIHTLRPIVTDAHRTGSVELVRLLSHYCCCYCCNLPLWLLLLALLLLLRPRPPPLPRNPVTPHLLLSGLLLLRGLLAKTQEEDAQLKPEKQERQRCTVANLFLPASVSSRGPSRPQRLAEHILGA